MHNDADLPVGQGAAAALARRTEAIFTKQSWGHWWDVMCAEHPILNIVFVHDDTPRFVRIWAFAFEVLCGLWGMALEVMLSYPEPDPECASYTAQWEKCDYCPEAIVGGVCYPEKIGQLGTVVQDQGDGTFAEVETTICPKAWKAARTACEDDGIKTRTIVGNKLCLWNRCAEECCDFYAGGCPDEPPDDSASPEHYMCLILVMIVFIPIVMIFEWAMDAYLTQPLPQALEPYLGGFCRGCAWICGQSAADDDAAADADGAGDASNAAVQERLGAWSQGAGEGGAPPAPDAAAGGRRRRRRASDLELARRSFAEPGDAVVGALPDDYAAAIRMLRELDEAADARADASDAARGARRPGARVGAPAAPDGGAPPAGDDGARRRAARRGPGGAPRSAAAGAPPAGDDDANRLAKLAAEDAARGDDAEAEEGPGGGEEIDGPDDHAGEVADWSSLASGPLQEEAPRADASTAAVNERLQTWLGAQTTPEPRPSRPDGWFSGLLGTGGEERSAAAAGGDGARVVEGGLDVNVAAKMMAEEPPPPPAEGWAARSVRRLASWRGGAARGGGGDDDGDDDDDVAVVTSAEAGASAIAKIAAEHGLDDEGAADDPAESPGSLRR